jgi:PAS domain S-box-containing protein
VPICRRLKMQIFAQAVAATEKKIILVFRLQSALVILALLAVGNGAELLKSIAFQIAILYFASNALLIFAPPQYFRSRSLIGAIVIVDVLFVSMCIHFSGNASNDIYLLYFLAIFMAAMSRDLRTTVVAAIVISAVYLWVSYSSFGGSEFLDSKHLLRIPLFFVTAFGAGYLANQARQRDMQHREDKLAAQELERRLEEEVKREKEITRLYHKLNKQHEELISSIKTGVLVVDKKSVLATFNTEAERLTGLDAQDALGHRIDDLESLTPLRPAIKSALSAISPQSCTESECVLRRGEGRDVTVGVSISPIFRDDGTIAGVIVAMRDTTELGGLKRRIQQSERLACLGGTALCMLRTIRGRLKSVISLACIQCERTDVADSMHQSAEAILAEMESIDKTVLEAIRFIRRDKPMVESLDFNELVESCVTGLRREMEHRSISANLDLDPYLPLVYGNALQLQQVLAQILANAVEAIDHSGGIRIITRANDREVLCSIEDSGPGVSDGFRDKAFEPLTSTKAGGTGIGLYISRKIVQDHGGTVEIAASANGSSLEIRLPSLSSEKAAAEGSQREDIDSGLAVA